MAKYAVHFTNTATGAVADTFKTMLAIIAADTAGHRARLLKMVVGPSEDAPVDLNVGLQLQRVDDVSAGGAGTAGSNPTPAKMDSESLATVITAGEDYVTGGVEPTTYGTVPLWVGDMHYYNTIIQEWAPEDAPVIQRDQLLGLLAAPRTAVARSLSGYFEFEQF